MYQSVATTLDNKLVAVRTALAARAPPQQSSGNSPSPITRWSIARCALEKGYGYTLPAATRANVQLPD